MRNESTSKGLNDSLIGAKLERDRERRNLFYGPCSDALCIPIIPACFQLSLCKWLDLLLAFCMIDLPYFGQGSAFLANTLRLFSFSK